MNTCPASSYGDVLLCLQEEKEDLLTKAQSSKVKAEEEEEEAERKRRLQEKIDEEKRERFSRLNSWKVCDGCWPDGSAADALESLCG